VIQLPSTNAAVRWLLDPVEHPILEQALEHAVRSRAQIRGVALLPPELWSAAYLLALVAELYNEPDLLDHRAWLGKRIRAKVGREITLETIGHEATLVANAYKDLTGVFDFKEKQNA
jgi:hypothetical protein